jgi:hypothetical protein
VILSLGACRLYGEPTRICNVRGLRRERYDSRSGERLRESREHRQVGVKLDALKSTHAECGQPVLVLQATKLALDGGASTIEIAPPLRLARNKRVKPGSLDPAGLGRALTSERRSHAALAFR